MNEFFLIQEHPVTHNWIKVGRRVDRYVLVSMWEQKVQRSNIPICIFCPETDSKDPKVLEGEVVFDLAFAFVV